MLKFPYKKKRREKNIEIFNMFKNKDFFSKPTIQLGYVNQGKGKFFFKNISISINCVGLKKNSKPNKGKGIIGFAKLSIQVKGKGNIFPYILYLLCKYKWLNIG
jgi:hypothetical protein